MNEAMKLEVFERFAKEIFKLQSDRRFLKQQGFDDLVDTCIGQMMGIELAVEALGYDGNEFMDYYKANRRRYSAEMVA